MTRCKHNTTHLPMQVKYSFAYSTSACDSLLVYS